MQATSVTLKRINVYFICSMMFFLKFLRDFLNLYNSKHIIFSITGIKQTETLKNNFHHFSLGKMVVHGPSLWGLLEKERKLLWYNKISHEKAFGTGIPKHCTFEKCLAFLAFCPCNQKYFSPYWCHIRKTHQSRSCVFLARRERMLPQTLNLFHAFSRLLSTSNQAAKAIHKAALVVLRKPKRATVSCDGTVLLVLEYGS